MKRAEADDEVHVIVVQGEDRAFCAGFDLQEYAEDRPADVGFAPIRAAPVESARPRAAYCLVCSRVESIVANAYDFLRFAIRGHGAVRIRLLRAAETLCKGDPAPEPIDDLIEEFHDAHHRLMECLERAAQHGPAPLPVIPQPSGVKLR